MSDIVEASDARAADVKETDDRLVKSNEPDWTPVRLTAGMAFKLAIIAVLLYLVISERGMGATFGLLVLLLGVWTVRDMVRLVIQRPKRPPTGADSDDS